MVITYNSFIIFCKTLIGQKFYTLYAHSPYVLKSVDNEQIVWTVKTGNERYSTKKWIERYLNGYARTQSLHPKDYPGTTESSFILPLIDLYNKHTNS